MIDINILQYGAIGVGLVVLTYTAALLRQELLRPKPRGEARNLILMFMAFSLIAFGIATYVELYKYKIDTVNHNQLAEIGNRVSQIDANIGVKYRDTLNNIPNNLSEIRARFIYSEDNICRNVKAMKKLLHQTEETECKLSPE